jgi:hypothetical protein
MQNSECKHQHGPCPYEDERRLDSEPGLISWAILPTADSCDDTTKQTTGDLNLHLRHQLRSFAPYTNLRLLLRKMYLPRIQIHFTYRPSSAVPLPSLS